MKTIWITWERQRRSVTLAESLGAKLFVLLNRSDDIPWRPARYAYLVWKTLVVLLRERPDICCCQNPSLILAVGLGLIRPLFGFTLIVDRHSNFRLDAEPGLGWRIFQAMSNLSLGLADLTIVTNQFLADHVTRTGGRSFVLPDKVPSLVEGSSRKLEGTCNVVFVCSYDEDEPVEEAIAAARQIDPSWRLYITGNYRRHVARFPSLASPPDTVKLTGFLTEGDYQTLLRSADVILALTTHDHTLMCVAYEAVSLVKPVVASDMSAMRAYFRRGFVFTENSAAAIAAALRSAVHQGQQLRSEATILRSELEADWNARFADLQHQIARRAS